MGTNTYVYLPASLPAVLTAPRVSVGSAVAVLYVAELYFAVDWPERWLCPWETIE